MLVINFKNADMYTSCNGTSTISLLKVTIMGSTVLTVNNDCLSGQGSVLYLQKFSCIYKL